jgi:hypothetical protein
MARRFTCTEDGSSKFREGCVTRDEIVVFDFESARMLGAVVRFDRLHGQAIEFLPCT